MTAGTPGADTKASPWLLLFFVFWIILFVALGIWQLERRVWKLDLIERVNTRIHAAPVSAPGPEEWGKISDKQDAYRHVFIQGHFLNDKETYVQASTVRGSGYWVLTPLVTDGGETVLINRGFVPPDKRDPALRAAAQSGGSVTVTGLLRMSEPGGSALRRNDAAHARWYSRDVTAIAQSHGLNRVAPYFIDADATPNPGGWPLGGMTVVSFYNEHLTYALSWFGLALVIGWRAVSAAGLMRRGGRGMLP